MVFLQFVTKFVLFEELQQVTDAYLLEESDRNDENTLEEVSANDDDGRRGYF